MSKKVFSILLACILVLCMCSAAWASETPFSLLKEKVSIASDDAGQIDVTFRVIGGTIPTSPILIDDDTVYDESVYNGAKHQNWLKTVNVSVDNGSTLLDVINQALTENNFDYLIENMNTNYVVSPDKQIKLINDPNACGEYGYWMVCVIADDETMTNYGSEKITTTAGPANRPNISNVTVNSGDNVILYWAYDDLFEDVTAETAYSNVVLKTPDVEFGESVEKTALPAPELSEDSAYAMGTAVILSVPVPKEDRNATVQYRMSSNPLTFEDNWQTSPEFTGLEKNTTYYFQARYIADNTDYYLDSIPSAYIAVTTTDGSMNVSFRLIGVEAPSASRQKGQTWSDGKIAYGNYGDFAYETWIRTTSKTTDDTVTVNEFVKSVLNEKGWSEGTAGGEVIDTYYFTGGKQTGTYVYSPKEAGSEKVYYHTNRSGIYMYTPYAGGDWYVTVIRNGEYINGFPGSADFDGLASLRDGDEVILHYALEPEYELSDGIKVDANHDDYIMHCLKTADITVADAAAISNVEALIDDIGEVTALSGTDISKAEEAYDALDADLKAYVENYETLTKAREAYDKIIEASIPLLTKPVLNVETAVVTTSSVEFTPPVCEEDEKASVYYYIAEEGSEDWAYQDQPLFEGLISGKTYQFKARFISSDPTKYKNSPDSDIVSIIVPEPKVTFRVIGGTRPTEGDISFASIFNDEIYDDSGYGNYQGAEYQNWIMPEDITLSEGMTAEDVIDAGFAKNNYVKGTDYELGGSQDVYVRAPECLGGELLQADIPDPGDFPGDSIGMYSGWYITIQRGEEFLESELLESELGASLLTDTLVQEGDIVILHFSYEPRFELGNSFGANYGDGAYADYVHQYLKVLNVSAQERADAYAFDDAVVALGTVNRQSGDEIDALLAEYEDMTDEQKSLVENYSLLTEAKKTYDTLMSSNVLVAPTLDAEAVTAVPDKTTKTATVTLAAPAKSEEDTGAIVQYRYKIEDGEWSSWGLNNEIKGLPLGKKCYFSARYLASGGSNMESSGSSAVVSLITPYLIETRAEWVSAVSAAPSDGTEVVLHITKTIDVSEGGSFTQKTPVGSNIVMVGDGGSLVSTQCGQLSNGIGLGKKSTLTLKDITYSSIYSSKSNANFGHMIWFDGEFATVNLDNAVIYGDSNQTGRIIYSNSKYCTLNIYSGAIDNVNSGYDDKDTLILLKDSKAIYVDSESELTVNLMPKGDIRIDGHIYAVDGSLYDDGAGGIVSGYLGMNLIPQEDTRVQSGSVLIGELRNYARYTYGTEYTAFAENELASMNAATAEAPYNMNEYVGTAGSLHINVSDAAAIPQKLTAPEISAEDLTIEIGKVTIPQLTSSEQENALFQYRILEKNDQGVYDWTLKSLYGQWYSHPMSFTENLAQDTEYALEVRFNAIGGNYANSDVTRITFRTGYTTTQLAAPVLTDLVDKTETSVTLSAPETSAEDATATFEYRMSTDQETWGEWQASNVFDGLKGGTTYYFQARYKAVYHTWTDSEGSNIVAVTTKASALQAPVLSETAEATINSVTLTVPAASAEDDEATLAYRYSLDGENWDNDWQDSNVFENLKSNTTYYFQACYVASSAAYKDSAASNTVTVKTLRDESHANFTVDTVKGVAGGTVNVTVSVNNNPGIIAAALDIAYDSNVLELVSVTDAGLLSDSMHSDTYTKNPYTLYWNMGTSKVNVDKDGVLATLTFKIKEGAELGESAVTLSYNPNNVYNVDMDNIAFDIVDGAVKIVDKLMGDVNNDFTVDSKDVTSLYRYLAGWEGYTSETLNLEVADVIADNNVNAKDATYLARAVAGWTGYDL